MSLLPLLVLTLAALLPVEASLRCYDCLSKSVPECFDDSKVQSFDQIECPKGENYCSTLFMKDVDGEQLVSRQCASSPRESQQLKNFVRGIHGKNLTVTKFDVCTTDLCNGSAPPISTSNNSPGNNSPVTGSPSNSAVNTISLCLLSLSLGAVAALRLTV